MNRFRKLDDGSWGLACDAVYARGEDVAVERRDGSTEVLQAGEYVGTNQYGDHLHRIWNQGNDRAAGGPRPAPSASGAAGSAASQPVVAPQPLSWVSKPAAIKDDEIPF